MFDCVETDEREVTIGIKVYNDLMIKAKTFESLVSVLYETSKLSWDKKSLYFDDRLLSAFLCGLDAFAYKSHIVLLNELEQEKEEDKKREAEITAENAEGVKPDE